MITHNKLLDEIIQSTLLTCSLFILFDIFIQGYQTYHLYALSSLALVGGASLYLHNHYLSIKLKTNQKQYSH
ncbi:hypothetical protein JI57_02730 [Psychromonas sp. PRT-SC03]|nr:hypothetical protein JI57_02730 [Psychromonas sp. PRT-SC03]